MFTGPYLDWNQKKIKAIVEHYGHPYFVHKKVLDLGCGHGDIGGVLHRLGSEVTGVDARQDHLKIVSKKYAGVKTVRADLDGPWPFYGKTFDLTIDIGLLCHLKDFEAHLKAVCTSSTYLILETAVLDSNDANGLIVKPDKNNAYDSSFNGFNSQISAANIERVLKECGMSFKRMDKAKLNSGNYVYDWQPALNNSYDSNKRRLWFCVKEIAQSQIDGSSLPRVSISLPSTNTGVFSSHLIDSRVPVTHQQIITSKSPNIPAVYKQIFNTGQNVTAIQRANVSNTYVTVAPGLPKVRLFFNYYVDKSSASRSQEIDVCLQKNINNPLFDLIIVESNDNPSFDLLFQKANLLSKENDINIICCSDIFFDNTVRLASNIKPKEVYALTRWEYGSDSRAIFSNLAGQDAWIFRGKVENVKGNFQLGKPGSDFRIAHEFQSAGYTVINPSGSIKAFHIHQSGIRHYTDNDKVEGPYLNVEPTNL